MPKFRSFSFYFIIPNLWKFSDKQGKKGSSKQNYVLDRSIQSDNKNEREIIENHFSNFHNVFQEKKCVHNSRSNEKSFSVTKFCSFFSYKMYTSIEFVIIQFNVYPIMSIKLANFGKKR